MNDRPTIHMTRLQLQLPVGLSLLLERDARWIHYRVLDPSGRAVSRGYWPTTDACWADLSNSVQGEKRNRLATWLGVS